MTRVYQHPDIVWRSNLSTIVLIVVALWGVWELWAAARAPAGDGSTGYMFGVAFVGLAAYGLQQVISEARDMVAAFDLDGATGRCVLRLWRPLGSRRLEADRDRLTGWRFHIKIGKRNQRTFLLCVDHPDQAQPLKIELRGNRAISEDLRRLAPEAIAEFEAKTGGKPPS